MADTNTRQGKRTPVTLKIKFKSETLEQFIERYAVDVSQGGIFIRTKEPLAVGTQMKFEFQLRDASPLIAGEGTVVWTRENDPSRPAIAPGMGVRFDRLADGSQTVLERILAEKAKQAPSRSGSVTAPGEASKAAMFTDTPTRVAPAAVVQEALGMRGRRNDSEQTPLPKPMPFHSDAEDFDERAFEEATKVRSLEELAAHSAGLTTGDDPLGDDPANATKIMPLDELAVRRHDSGGHADSINDDPPLSGPPPDRSGPIGRAIFDRDSAPGLPSPPAVEPARQRMLDTTPSPRNEPPIGGAVPAPAPPPVRQSHPGVSNPSITPPPAAEARTQLGITPPNTQSPPVTAASSADAVTDAVGPEPSRPVAPSRPSSAPIVIGILVVVAAAIGAVWWFVLREEVQNNVAKQSSGSGSAGVATAPGSGSALPGSGSDVAMAGNGSDAAGSGSAMAGSGSGSDVAMAGSGSAMAGSADVPGGPIVDTVITSAARGATVEIVGTEMKGPVPFTAKLEKGKVYKARVMATGFTVSEIDVTGGVRATAKLVLKPRVVSVTTDPAGASIYVDGVDTGRVTPSDVTLTAAQAGRARVRITVRRTGFRQVDMTVEAKAFQDAGGTMTTAIEAKLTQQQVVRPPPQGSNTGGSGPTGTGSGSAGTTPGAGGTGSGSDATGTGTGSTPTPTPTPGTGSGSGSAAKPPATGSGAQPPSGSLGGSLGGGTTPLSTKPSEPEPTWSK